MEKNLNDKKVNFQGARMKWFDRALSAFLAGMVFLIAIQIYLGARIGTIQLDYPKWVGLFILLCALYLFYVAYRGKSPF